MTPNALLAEYLEIKGLKITVERGGFVFEGNGLKYDATCLCPEEAFIKALLFLSRGAA